MAHVEGAFDQVNQRLGSIERRLDAMDSRFNHVDSRFNWVVGTIVATWVTMMGTQVGTILAIFYHPR